MARYWIGKNGKWVKNKKDAVPVCPCCYDRLMSFYKKNKKECFLHGKSKNA